MAGVTLGLLREGIAAAYFFPFLWCADEIIYACLEPFFRLDLEQTLQFGAGSLFAIEDGITTLKQRLALGKTERTEEIAQARHWHEVVAAHVNPPQKSDICHSSKKI